MVVEDTRRRPTNYWNSRSALMLVRKALGNETWTPNEGEDLWQALAREVRGLNRIGEDGCFPDDEGTATILAFRTRLFAFASLMEGFARHVYKRFGRDCWERIRNRLHDPKEVIFFDLLRALSHAAHPHVADALQDVSIRGVSYELPGGIPFAYRDRDCGIAPLSEVGQRMVRRLVSDGLATSRSQKGVLPSLKGAKRVQVLVLPGIEYSVTYDGSPTAHLENQEALLFRALLAANRNRGEGTGIVPYSVLEDAVGWGQRPKAPPEDAVEINSLTGKLQEKETPVDQTTTPPHTASAPLRTCKKVLNGILSRAFGKSPPDRLEWIQPVRTKGYHLNLSVVWEVAKEKDREPGVHFSGLINKDQCK